MGITTVEALALQTLVRNGEAGDEVFCLGRPVLYMTERHLRDFVRGFGLDWSDSTIAEILGAPYGDPMLHRLGFREIRSMDASAYERADFIHDLNQPMPAEFCNTTSFLFAGGIVEHIFDVATVLHNISKLLRIGGTVLLTTPANGFGGHGFYQFSPELFYRYFETNGFEDARVYVVGMSYPQKWFLAVDPRVARTRVEFLTMEPTILVAIARKTEAVAELVIPQQSDYSDDAWQTAPEEIERNYARIKERGLGVAGKLAKRGQTAASVALRYLAGTGMPGLSGLAAFRPIDPFSVDRL